MRILAVHLQNIMEYASLRGADRQEMLAAIKHPLPDFDDETASIHADDYYAVIHAIDEVLNDDLLGIRSGHYLNMKALGLIYRISLQSTTIEEALFYLNSYLNSTFPIIDLSTDTTSDAYTTIRLKIKNGRQRINRIILENVLTVMAREIKMMTGERTPVDLFSSHHTREYPENWKKGESFYLQFKSTLLKATMKDKSRLHLDILVPEYLKLIEALKPRKSFASKVKVASLNLAGPELPDLETVSGSLNLTPRTLQRRLHAENTTFRQVIGELKQKISKLLLLHDRYTVADVSFALGYSEPAAFIHSFKRWYGDSPQKIRTELVQNKLP